MVSTAYRQIRDGLVREQGAVVGGFRAALRGLARDFVANDAEEEGWELDECVDAEFSECFGDIRCIPAAYRIDRDPKAYRGCVIHVWEIETSVYDRSHKLQAYGQIADGDGPCINLHIIDRFGREDAVLNTDMLMPFCYAGYYPDNVLDEHERACRQRGRSESSAEASL